MLLILIGSSIAVQPSTNNPLGDRSAHDGRATMRVKSRVIVEIERDNIVVILHLKEINGSAISKKKSINRGNQSYPNGILEGPFAFRVLQH
ncbi:hypothetical protein NC651_010740 [Populus alba x Populus x berolinensis]|nr:hypothetical protein NC651_010740 [Populus alba x Populus x berolinensis]